MTRQSVFIDNGPDVLGQKPQQKKSSLTEPASNDDTAAGDFVSPQQEPSTDDDMPLE